MLANVNLGKQDKNGIVIRMFDLLRNWEESNRHKLIQYLDMPKWFISQLNDIKCSENYRPDYFFDGDILFVSMVLKYSATFDNKTFNKLKIANSELLKYVNNSDASFEISTFHNTLVQGLDYMELEQ